MAEIYVEKAYYENGNLKMEIPFKNNKKQGMSKGYYESGKLQYEMPYKKDMLQGIEKVYDENGNLNTQANKRSKKPYSSLFNAKYSNSSIKS
ncbi:toxin-antitoxin system YwqK family antitoxin [Helicobacter bilis]|uniref:toxin-antitoxin system YwqK family antitoxin n=1 Tax=Helicobacter bilis TaxID=37372 RepID=UPI00068DAD83|nr:hypothetical protein [Helicobacter bilis]TLE08480.1 hypothetical protein LS78_005490 [Helicobacter bilis]